MQRQMHMRERLLRVASYLSTELRELADLQQRNYDLRSFATTHSFAAISCYIDK